jgi:hypothetical protein
VASGTEQQGRTIQPKVDGETKPVSTDKPKASVASAAFDTGAVTETASGKQNDEAATRNAKRAKSETTTKAPARKAVKTPTTPRSKTTL